MFCASSSRWLNFILFVNRYCVSVCAVLVALGIAPNADAASKAGRIIQEARCKVLIQGPLDVSEGEELFIYSRSAKASRSVGSVQILKNKGARLVGRVLGASECRKFRGMYVNAGTAASSPSKRRVARKGPPPLLKLLFGGGPGLSNATLSGISREPVVEDYPLVLTTLDLALEAYPFSFMRCTASWQSVLGIEATFRYVTSLSNVEATTANPTSGEELDLEMSFKRLNFKAGAVARLELWKQRLFGDARTGYYFSRTTSVLEKLVNVPEGSSTVPLEISPLRDLGLTGFYAMGGLQFQPTQSFRARLNVGTVLGADYQIDNRLLDSLRDAQAVADPIELLSTFLLETALGYSIGKVSLGINFSLEKYAGTALYPNKGITEPGFISEQFINYSLNASYLL